MRMESPKKPAKSVGRPFAENKRNVRVDVKMNTEEIERLDYCVGITGKDRAKIIREGVQLIYDDIKGKS